MTDALTTNSLQPSTPFVWQFRTRVDKGSGVLRAGRQPGRGSERRLQTWIWVIWMAMAISTAWVANDGEPRPGVVE